MLLIFPSDAVDTGVLALRALKERGDQFFAAHSGTCRQLVKVHFARVCSAPIGTRDDKRFDFFGHAVNIAVLLTSDGLALTPQTRQHFKKTHSADKLYFRRGQAL